MDLPDSPPTVLLRGEVAAKSTDSHNVGSSSSSGTTTTTTTATQILAASTSSSNVPSPHAPLSLHSVPTASIIKKEKSTAIERRRTSTPASKILHQKINKKERKQLKPHVPGAKRALSRSTIMDYLDVEEDSSTNLLMPPSKLKRTQRESDMANIPLYRTKQTSADPGKQASIRQQLFPNPPPKTKYPSASASSASATSTESCTHLVSTATFYRSRGRADNIKHDIPIYDPFRQPKLEILELEEENKALQTTATASASDSSNAINPELYMCSPSTPEQQGFQQVSPISDLEGVEEISLHSLIEGMDMEPHVFDMEDEECDVVDSNKSDDVLTRILSQSPLLFSDPQTSLLPSPDITVKSNPGDDDTQITTSESSQITARTTTQLTKVWEKFVKIGNGQQAKCKICGREVSRGKKLGHLTNAGMHQHLRTHHSAMVLGEESVVANSSGVAKAMGAPKKIHTTSGVARTVTLPTKLAQLTLKQFGGFQASRLSRQHKRAITRLIGQLVAVGGSPYYVIEGLPFKQLMALIVPQYKVPSRTTFSRSIVPSLYTSCVGVLKEEFRKIAGHTISVHFTTDIWSAPSGQHSFLSLTGHWWQPQDPLPVSSAGRSKKGSKKVEPAVSAMTGHRSFLLHVEVMEHEHTAHNILIGLKKMVRNWIGEKAGTNVQMGFVVTDGAPNMVKAIREGRFTGVRCCAHVLHLIVRRAIEKDSGGRLLNLLESCRKIAGYFHRSHKAIQLLREEQKKAGIKQHQIKQDVSTRWNSTYEMLQRLLEQQPAIHAMAYSHSIGIPNPFIREEWVMIGQVIAVLKPFKDLTELFSEDNASIGQVILSFSHLTSKLNRFLSSSTLHDEEEVLPDVLSFIKRLLEQLDRRYKELLDSCPDLMLASMCDPRLKCRMPMAVNALTTWKDRLVDRVRDAQKKHLTQPHGEGVDEDIRDVMPSTSSSAISGELSGGLSFWAEALGNSGSSRSQYRPKSNAAVVVRDYLSEPAMPPETHPLSYWDEQRRKWPALAIVAQELLSCPPTTVCSERIFSVSGNIMSPQRTSLAPELMEKMTFLKVNVPKLDFPTLSYDSN